MTIPVINANGICCQSGHRYLLRDIHWEVKQGEHWVIFGMNGSGKTTLLSLIAGFRKQTKGSLEVLGQTYGSDNVLALRKRIGWVSSSFFEKYFSKENAMHIVLSGLRGTFCPDDAITDHDVVLAKMLLRQLNLGDKMDRPYHTMSKGEQQNVLIARALIAGPDILALDEPGTGLDIQARESMLQIVRQLAEKTNMTLIYVTHYPEEIMDVFDQCLLLRNGRIYATGKTTELMTTEELSGFLEKPVSVEHPNGKFQVSLNTNIDVCDLISELGLEVLR
ncbi:MAG: ATP-binding cassette domain-containing protein [Peptococcaceae bacterium]|nr:ATP-binding cassette domain-containing protein [Peptococcaceae bacterium]